MNWAFWKRKRARRAAPATPGRPEPDFDSVDDDAEADEAAARALRVRTRRRLIGACALLLTAVILVPMALDPAPRVVPDTIPIDLPSDKTAFAPRLSAPAADAAGGAAAGTAADAPAVPAAPGAAADAAADAPAPPAATPRAAPADHSAHSKKHAGADSPAAPARLFVQAAALARESAARELAGRIAKSGLSPFVERTDTSEGVRYRVRLGPYASRGEAERSRARLRALGVDANIVGA